MDINLSKRGIGNGIGWEIEWVEEALFGPAYTLNAGPEKGFIERCGFD
jgi:hypothetical protein